jgi:hypothetical protein
MSETPPTGRPSAPGPSGFPPGLPPPGPWGPAAPVASNRPARWPMFVMFLITLVAVGAAVAAWLRPIPHNISATPAAPSYNEQQVADAKAKVCAAYEKVLKTSNVNSARTAGDDPNSQLLIAINWRQVFIASSIYLSTTLAEQPAAPPDLSTEVKNLIDLYQVVTLDGMVGDRNDAGHNAANQTGETIQSLCK